MALRLVLALLSVLAVSMSGTEAQGIRTCNDVLKELSEKGIRTFVNAFDDPSPRSPLKNELCVDLNEFR